MQYVSTHLYMSKSFMQLNVCTCSLSVLYNYDHSQLCWVLTQVYTIHGYHVYTCSTTATGLLINCPAVKMLALHDFFVVSSSSLFTVYIVHTYMCTNSLTNSSYPMWLHGVCDSLRVSPCWCKIKRHTYVPLDYYSGHNWTGTAQWVYLLQWPLWVMVMLWLVHGENFTGVDMHDSVMWYIRILYVYSVFTLCT